MALSAELRHQLPAWLPACNTLHDPLLGVVRLVASQELVVFLDAILHQLLQLILDQPIQVILHGYLCMVPPLLAVAVTHHADHRVQAMAQRSSKRTERRWRSCKSHA